MNEHFCSKGFDSIVKFTVFDNYCFLDFNDWKIAESFVAMYNGMTINGQNCSVSIKKSPNRPRPPPVRENFRENEAPFRPAKDFHRSFDGRKPYNSRTISITGVDFAEITERDLFELCRTKGFVRQVEIRNRIGLIQFETQEDAENAVRVLHCLKYGNYVLNVEKVPDLPLNLPKVSIPLTIMDEKFLSDNKRL